MEYRPEVYDQHSKDHAYESQPADVRVTRQISAEVKVVHHLVNESKLVTEGRIRAEERDDIRIRKSTRYLGLLEKPL